MSLSNDLDQFALSPFSNQLIQSGYVSLPRMQQALIEAKKTGRPIMQILEQITGNPLPLTLLRQYKDHNLFTLKILHGIEFINPETEPVDMEQITELIQKIIPFEFCRRHQVLPLKQLETSSDQISSLLVAMVNPSHGEAQEMLTELLRSHKMSWQRVGISQEDYNGLIEQYTPPLRNSYPEDRALDATLVDATEIFEEVPKEAVTIVQEDPSSPIVTLVNKILITAIERQGTQIEIDPQENSLLVLYRQGQAENLQPLFDPLPKKVAAPIISQLKIMAGLDISQQQTPQKGRIVKQDDQRTIYFFINTLPTFHGEKVSIRIVDSTVKPPTLETLITDESLVQSLPTMTDYPSGLLLVSSADKLGLSSLLYSLVSRKNPQQLNIATVEESMSHILPGVTQIEVDRDGDKDYASVLQSLSKQDLDILMVDHLREPTIARMVVEMSQSCLILTSLIANDGASALAHLSQMVDKSLLADTFIGIIHQYMVPRLCPTCLSVHDPDPAELAKFGIPSAKKAEITFYQPRILSDEALEQARERGRLCRQCNGKGYQGHTRVYEMLQGTPSLKTAIAQGAQRKTFQQAALEEDSVSPLGAALELVAQGQVSLADVEALFPDHLLNFSTSESVKDLAVDLTERLAKFEKLLVALTEEFQELKQALQSKPSSSPGLNSANALDETITETPATGELPEEEEIDLSKETIAADSPFYEELTDPGDWEDLKRELQPEQETIAADFPNPEDSGKAEEFNPFNSIPDPWS